MVPHPEKPEASAKPREIRVATAREFDTAISQLHEESSADSAILLFRGQTQRYFEDLGEECIRPSLCRAGTPPVTAADREPFLEAFGQYLLGESARGVALPSYWAMPVSVMRGGGSISIFDVTALEKVPLTWMAVLQHYGFPTEMLDVTADPEVALAFGLWSFAYPPKPEAATGVVYVFAMPVSEEGRPTHVELKPLFTWDEHLRPVRQSGSLLCSLYEDPDPEALKKDPNRYARYLAAVLVLEDSEQLRREVLTRSNRFTGDYLFPSNLEDRLYRFLLDAQERASSAPKVKVPEREKNRKGLPLFDNLPLVEPLTGSLEIGKFGQIRACRGFTGSNSRAFVVMNLYAGDSPEIRKAQENIANVLGLVGKDVPLEKVLCDNLDRGATIPGPLSMFEPSAFTWYWSFQDCLPKPLEIRGIDNRRRAKAHAGEFAATRALVAGRSVLLAHLEMSRRSLTTYPLDVLHLNTMATKFFDTATIGDFRLWIHFIRELAAGARKHGVSLEPHPVLAFFAALYALHRPSPGTPGPSGSGSKPWLTSIVSGLLHSPSGLTELGEATGRILERIGVAQSFFETATPSGRYLNLTRLQLYLIQHRGMDLVSEAQGLMRELLAAAGGRLGEVDLVLRALAELYALRMGFDTYLHIRPNWKAYGLGYVYSRAPELFPAKLSWLELLRFNKERNRLFRLWRVVLRRYEDAVQSAEKLMTSKPGSYALVINGAYRSLFETMLERRRISYTTIQPRFS